MSGIFDKARVLTLGSVNDLLDAAIDRNSPSVVRQRVRDLEGAIENLSNNNVINIGNLRRLVREKAELDAKIATDLVTITHLQASTDPNAPLIARTKAGLVLTEKTQTATLASQIESQTKTNSDFALTLSNLEAQHDQMVARVHELESIDRDTKAKEQAAHAISAAGVALSATNNTSIDATRAKMLGRNDVANAKFDAAVGSLPSTESSSDDIDALLASLKQPELATA